MNIAAFVGRDKQSDLLNNRVVGEKVQHSMKSNKQYLITRVPEKYLTIKENAKTQNRIVMPTAVATNRNGDCVHVVDVSSVAIVRTIGTYGIKNLSPYKADVENIAKNLKIGDQVTQIYVDGDNDDVLIFDLSRKEVIIIDQCTTAKNVRSRRSLYLVWIM